MRRMLYRWVEQKEGLRIITQWSLTFSFYAGSTGFEAFFTKDLVLVVAVHSKKRGLKTVSLTEPLTPQKWVRVLFVIGEGWSVFMLCSTWCPAFNVCGVQQ